MSFEIFQAEIDDGLNDVIISNAKSGCLLFTKANSTLLNSQKSYVDTKNSLLTKAGISVDDDTLHILDSILASVGRNANDDVFLKEELYAARHNAVDKPVNIEHNPKDIVGHIKATMMLDCDYNIIPEDTKIEDIPDKFHLADSSVIYKAWEDDDQEKLILETIEKTQSGEKFVSMECFFRGFDYGVKKDSTKEEYIIARNKDTAFLTKHLRIYGGKGIYNGYSISRVLRNIKFNGKGIVDNPANKESIIFSETTPFAHAKRIDNVYDILETSINKELIMSDTNETLITELKTAKASLETKVQELQAKLDEVNQASSKAKVVELEQSLASKTQEVTELQTKVSGLEVVKAEMNTKIEEVTARAQKAEEELQTIAKENQKNTRISQLVEAGLPKDEAVAKAEKFSALNDEMFAEIVVLAKSSVKTEVKKETVESATAKVLDGAEPKTETPVTGATETDNVEREKAQASLSEFLSSQLEHLKSNKS